MTRTALLCFAVFLAGCANPSAPVNATSVEPTGEPWYPSTLQQLIAINREASDQFAKGNIDQAASAVTKGQLLTARLLAVPRPTLAAMEAASDLDDLYGRMLMSNKHYGWARMQFQKNLARWTNWRPESTETLSRKKVAQAAIAKCDKAIAE